MAALKGGGCGGSCSPMIWTNILNNFVVYFDQISFFINLSLFLIPKKTEKQGAITLSNMFYINIYKYTIL